MRHAYLLVAFFVALGCDEPPAFRVPSGAVLAIALDVRLPVPVLGTWTVDGFSETLRMELAKYSIVVLDRRSLPSPVALIDLGQVTYRQWQEVDVAVANEGETTLLGKIRVPDLQMTTLDVAAHPVAELIARWVWSPEGGAAKARLGDAR